MVFIIILTWNGKKYLPKLFKSLSNLTYPKEKLKIVVIDSASSDGTVKYLENLMRDPSVPLSGIGVNLVKLKTNLGFASGNNIGMRHALDNGAEYVVLLNQDTVVEPDFLSELIRAAESDKQIGVVQPLILYYQKKDEINSWGNNLHYLGYGMSGGNHQKITHYPLPITRYDEITYASAAAVLYKSELLKQIGLFDEFFFAYHEDSDICLRARLAGYRIVLASQAVVYHNYSFPTKKNKQRYFWLEKNRLYLIFKFYKIKTLILILPMIIFMDLGQFVFAIKNGYLWQWLKSRLWFIFNFKKFYLARRMVQKSRQISDKELMKDFVCEIKYQEVANPLLDKIGNPVMRLYWEVAKRFI